MNTEFLFGLLDPGPWALVAITLVLTHITIVAVTLFLHRCQAHRALDLHPVLSHFFRFWLWLTTGMVTAEWVAVHRRHHARCETPEDPHSPQILGISKVLWEGAELYRAAIENSDLVARYSHGTPDDWVERNLYRRWQWHGLALMLIIDIVLFGIPGVAVWAVQMLWIPFFAAGVINGIGHWWGYRNFDSPDAATNICPWGILIGGEELHNNHHAFPSSARLSNKPWEIDIGWAYIRVFSLLGLARVRRVARQPVLAPGKNAVDLETVRAVVTHRMHVLASFGRDVVKPVARCELDGDPACRRLYRQFRQSLTRDAAKLDAVTRERLRQLLGEKPVLATVQQFHQRLQAVWEERAPSQEALIASLQEWCAQAEATGIEALQRFARNLKRYQPAIT